VVSFFVFLGLSIVFLIYVPTAQAPQPPQYEEKSTVIEKKAVVVIDKPFELPFEPVSFAFQNITYTVKTPDGEELPLLDDITGFFEPGVVAALMGSSGAGTIDVIY